MLPVSFPQPVQCPDIFILRFSLSLCNGPGPLFLLVMSVFPSPSCCLHLLNYWVSKCLRALYTLRSVQQLCSRLSNPSLFKSGYCVLFCTWPVLPLFHRLVNSPSSVVCVPLPLLLSAGEDSAFWLSTPSASRPARGASVFPVLQRQRECNPCCSPLAGCLPPRLPQQVSVLPEPHGRAILKWRPSYCAPLQGRVAWILAQI